MITILYYIKNKTIVTQINIQQVNDIPMQQETICHLINSIQPQIGNIIQYYKKEDRVIVQYINTNTKVRCSFTAYIYIIYIYIYIYIYIAYATCIFWV